MQTDSNTPNLEMLSHLKIIDSEMFRIVQHFVDFELWSLKIDKDWLIIRKSTNHATEALVNNPIYYYEGK